VSVRAAVQPIELNFTLKDKTACRSIANWADASHRCPQLAFNEH